MTEYQTHIFNYQFEGKHYTIDVVAKDADEAEKRLKALNWATYDGVLVARMPKRLGVFARFMVAVRNKTKAMLG